MNRSLRSIIAVFISALLFSAFSPGLRAEEGYYAVPDGIYSKRVLPAIRFGAEYDSFDLNQHAYYMRRQTLSAYGEWAFNEYFSLAATLPWTRRTETKTQTATRFDNMGLGAHAAIPGSSFIPVGGLDMTLPTGREQEGIGSKRIFNMEPYAGLGYYDGAFSILGLVRYNTQTNRDFKEDPDQGDDFARTWLYNVNLGWNFEAVDLLLEYQYKYTYDPNPKRKSTHTIAPGINVKIDQVILSLSVPYSLSRERDFGAGVMVRAGMRF